MGNKDDIFWQKWTTAGMILWLIVLSIGHFLQNKLIQNILDFTGELSTNIGTIFQLLK